MSKILMTFSYKAQSSGAAYSSANTRIMTLGTQIENTIPPFVGTIVNDATNGWSFTALKTCDISVSVSWGSSTNGAFSVNATDVEMDTAVFSIAANKFYGYESNAGTNNISAASIRLNPGDVLRLHGQQASGSLNGAFSLTGISL